MAIYEFKCQTCTSRVSFAGAHDAARAGWTIAEVRFGDRLRHFVNCEKHTPSWIKTAMGEPDNAKKK